MDGQNITVKIAGSTYPLKASTPEMERLMRLAAEAINAKYAAYDAKFPDKSVADKLAFVTMNEAISRITAQKKCADMEEKIKQLISETGSYLENIDKK